MAVLVAVRGVGLCLECVAEAEHRDCACRKS
jgi:hypothetical protein